MLSEREIQMNGQTDAYLFGQVLGTHSFLLKDGFLRPDEYSEISMACSTAYPAITAMTAPRATRRPRWHG